MLTKTIQVRKCRIVTCGVTLLILILFIMYNDIDIKKLTDLKQCPLCYGQDFCPKLFNGSVKIHSVSLGNAKNVYFARYNSSNVVLKKLGNDKEILKARQRVREVVKCQANVECNLQGSLRKLLLVKDFNLMDTMVPLLNNESDLFRCPSKRLYEKVFTLLRKDAVSQNVEEYINSLFNLLTVNIINPEPLILQMFPSSKGWFFAEYYGSCGLVSVVKDEGWPLLNFVDYPWLFRVNLTLQILIMAMNLTHCPGNWSVYCLDMSMDNFAVGADNVVRIVDAENFLIVDKEDVIRRKPLNWNQTAVSVMDDCESNCIGFSTTELCNHVEADHNFYAVCRTILSKYAYRGAKEYGLLHDIPEVTDDEMMLGFLINECINPKLSGRRMTSAQNLITSFQIILRDL
ncbi:divergent protein kinase domain 2A-like isoform X1 [Argonauta hians]